MPAWMFYALVTVAAVALGTGLLWMDGAPLQGPIMTINIFGTLLTTFPLVMMQNLNKTARASLQAFRPALGKLQAEYRELEDRLTTTSTREVWIAVALGALFTTLSVAGNPGGWGFAGKLSAATATYILLQGTLLDVGVIALILRLIKGIRCIALIHRKATNINLHERDSHHAFSRLTLVAAIGLLVPVYGYVIVVRSAEAGQSSPFSGADTAMVTVFVLLSAVVFIVPIYGMRRRLEDLKKQALRRCDERFQSAAKLLHARLDAGSLNDLEGLNHAMATLTLEREALHRISTWPWAADTLRRYISTVALPVFVFLLGRYIGRFLGL
jgi:hypothetical protein